MPTVCQLSCYVLDPLLSFHPGCYSHFGPYLFQLVTFSTWSGWTARREYLGPSLAMAVMGLSLLASTPTMTVMALMIPPLRRAVLMTAFASMIVY